MLQLLGYPDQLDGYEQHYKTDLQGQDLVSTCPRSFAELHSAAASCHHLNCPDSLMKDRWGEFGLLTQVTHLYIGYIIFYVRLKGSMPHY